MAKLLNSVDLLGLGALDGGLNPTYGVLVGGGTAAVTQVVARHVGGSQHAEMIGLGMGLAASGLLFAMPATRQAALASAIGAVLASGVALMGKWFMGEATVPAKVVSPEVKGLGFPQARALNGLGLPRISALNGIGYPTIDPVSQAQGTIPGVAGSHLAGPGGGTPPVSLLGAPSAAQVHLLGVGGPMTHSLSAAYGATLLGAGR